MAGKVRFVVDVDGGPHELLSIKENPDKSLLLLLPDVGYVGTDGGQRFSVHNTENQEYHTIMQTLKRSYGERRSPQKVLLNKIDQYAIVTTKRCATLGGKAKPPSNRSADTIISIGTSHSSRHALAFSVVVSRTGQAVQNHPGYQAHHVDLTIYRVSILVNYFMANAAEPSHSIELVTSTPTAVDGTFSELDRPVSLSKEDITNGHFSHLSALGIGLYGLLMQKVPEKYENVIFERCSQVMSTSNLEDENLVISTLIMPPKESIKTSVQQRIFQ
ncbi:hypothetical protein [Sphingomonas sp. SAFR-052]|uniref:hypothetical protein n=1 Tax=Sphingomonas sp. SAFR-052 TaxID=3436867 RepID=UPI003F80A146